MLLFGGLLGYSSWRLTLGFGTFAESLPDKIEKSGHWLQEKTSRLPDDIMDRGIAWAKAHAREIAQIGHNVIGWFGEEVLSRLFSLLSLIFSGEYLIIKS